MTARRATSSRDPVSEREPLTRYLASVGTRDREQRLREQAAQNPYPSPGAGPGSPPPFGPAPAKAPMSTGVIVAIVVGVVVVLTAGVAIAAIAAVTLLGRPATSNFVSVGPAVQDPVSTTSPRAPTTLGQGSTAGPPVVAPPAPGASITGTTPCPAADGSSARTTSFAAAPPSCIDAAKTYRATFDTNMGAFTIDLDAAKMPTTTNNFVVLARYHYYDDTAVFRLDPSIDIAQGGSPATNSASDPGPGYTIPDEGGPFTYRTGDLVMARTAQPNSSSAQFFLASGPKVSLLDSQGTYLRFGTVTAGQDVVDAIAALYEPFPATSPMAGLGGAPSKAVVITKVTIAES